MKTLQELILEHCESQQLNKCSTPKYTFYQDQLESLINEVIAQRLGEPLGYISKDGYKSLQEGIYGVAIFEQTNRRKIPVYAINHLIDHKG
jgi:hypothetical protein